MVHFTIYVLLHLFPPSDHPSTPSLFHSRFPSNVFFSGLLGTIIHLKCLENNNSHRIVMKSVVAVVSVLHLDPA